MKLIITPQAQKDYKGLPKSEQKKVKRKLSMLEIDSYIGKKLGGELSELRSLRAWPYRILYYIDSKKDIYITSIIHRQSAY